MNIVGDIAVSLAAALIGVIAAWVWNKATTELRLRGRKKIWKVYAEDRTCVIVGRFLEYKQFEPTGFMGVGDAIAVSELKSLFTRLNGKEIDILYSDKVEGEILKQNLILVGGPDHNLITREVMARIKTTVKFGDPRLNEVAIYDTLEDKLMAPKVDARTGQVLKDYGLILRAKNPFAADKWVTLFAGSFGYGSWAAVLYVASGQLSKQKKISVKMPFEVLVENEVIADAPQNIQPIILRQLPD